MFSIARANVASRCGRACFGEKVHLRNSEPCRVLSRKPIKAEHMKSYSNLTTPTFPNLTMANSCPNDE